MTSYMCTQPTSTGVFTSSEARSLRTFVCDDSVNILIPNIFKSCPPWTGILTDINIAGTQYNNIPLEITYQTSELELYESDYIEVEIPTGLTYVPAQPIIYGIANQSDGYAVNPSYITAFKAKIYTLVCRDYPTIRSYIRINEVKNNYGGDIIGDNLEYISSVTCPNQLWLTGYKCNMQDNLFISGVYKYA